MRCCSLALLLLLPCSVVHAAQGNRLTYLDEANPYYVSRTFPRLTTPQWVGEEGVEAVVILSIDDMKDSKRYETFLRPILTRLQQVEGRAAHSIMTCVADPADEHLQKWLKEGVSLETHTFDHPCPLLAGGDFDKAASTYNRCVDLLASVPNNRPVAFRMPCCDSLNTLSPRFLAEIFNKKTAKVNFLSIDSSVFNVCTPNDPELPRELVMENGQERFRKFGIPTFVNTIDDYCYPYVIDKLCWEIPCATPTDWQAQYLFKENASPQLLRAWKAGLDAAVIKQGVFCLVYHPHGWSKPQQIVDLIDHAVAKHGKKVKFLTFKDVLERLNKNLLGGQSLRSAKGGDNGVRLLDLNNDGYIDVVIGNEKLKQTRIWSPKEKKWLVSDFPISLVTKGRPVQERFGILHDDGLPSFLVSNENRPTGAFHFDGTRWRQDPTLLDGLEINRERITTGAGGQDEGVRLRDLDGDGICELIVSNPQEQAVFSWSKNKRRWTLLPFKLPAGATIVDERGRDNGVRFVDVDEDGHDDFLISNEKQSGLYLFTSMEKGWSTVALSGKAGELPLAARAGTNNGMWFHSRKLCVQNEDVLKFESRSFNDLLAKVEPTARSPESSRRSIKVHAGFEVELVAAEPLVQSPIGFAWGPDSKLWVVEMGDYPLGVDGKGKPGGRIKYLEDTKGTGKYDKATVFLENLPFPTSVLPWKKGVIVTCAPDIFYAEDTKGTGKADLRVDLYSGFTPGNQQHRVNTLAWGLDNWLYCANGDSGGTVKSLKTGQTVNLRGRDCRIRPDEGLIDLTTGQTQYVRSRDDWNHWFGNNNTNPMYHFVLQDHYMRRNPELLTPNPRENISVVPGASLVFPISRTLPRFNSPGSENHFTSACSAIVYRDDLFGPEFSKSTFVSEPVHNLIHREVLSQKGVTFTSRRADDELTSEFLASSDGWFRPTMIQTGPDGALWIADMYRAVIEHPEWIPKDWQKRIDLRAGHEMGRIYRVVPVGARKRPIPRLDRLDTAELVAALDSPSGWQRDTVQQMLLWKNDRAAVPHLTKLALECPRPLGRVHALCTLEGLQSLPAEQVLTALRDPHPGVREQAVPLCEGLLAKTPALGEELLKMTSDPSPFVRLQLAYTLGEWKSARAGTALADLATLEYAAATIEIDREAAALLGVTIADVYRAILWYSAPTRLLDLKRWEDGGAGFDSLVEVVLPPYRTVKLQDLETLPIRSPNAVVNLYLRDVARIRWGVQMKGNDRHVAAAALSSVNATNLDETLRGVMARSPRGAPPARLLEDLLRLARSFKNSKAMVTLLESISTAENGQYAAWQYTALAGLLDFLDGRGTPLVELREEGDDVQAAVKKLDGLFVQARTLAGSDKANVEERIAALALLGRGFDRQAEDQKLLAGLLVPQTPDNVQSAAIVALGQGKDAHLAGLLLRGWKSYSPNLRKQVQSTLLRRPEWARAVLDGVKGKDILVSDLELTTRQALLQHADADIRKLAGAVFAGAVNADRAKVLAMYDAVPKLAGDAKRGSMIFSKNCAQCHRLGKTGHAVGPDIESIGDRSSQGLLTAILDPNRVVEARYVSYTALTKNGLTLTGVLASETGNSITLLGPEGKQQMVLRSDLDQLFSTGKSPMPEGLEKEIDVQAMADLIAFIRASAPPPAGSSSRMWRPSGRAEIKYDVPFFLTFS